MNTKNVVRYLNYAKFAAAGALFGLAVVNTIYQFMGSSVTDSAENIAMGCGAVLVAGCVKALHVL
jgi:hypothetical protein